MKNSKITFIRIAKEIAKNSTCIRKKVGAILVKDNRILATGYNGVFSKKTHCEDLFKFNSRSSIFLKSHARFSDIHEIHAEQNLIAICCTNLINTKNCDVYLTLSPCIHCAKLLVACKVKNVYFSEVYDRQPEGITILKNHGINAVKIKDKK